MPSSKSSARVLRASCMMYWAACRLPSKLPFACATGIYRIFKEALTNIARHSGATEVMLRLSATTGEIVMEIIGA